MHFILLFVTLFVFSLGSASTVVAQERPNFLLIISDDQPEGTLGQFMPQTQSRIFDAGLEFTKAYVTTPACCPSRSSILTGMYAFKHGVLVNKDELKHPTFPKFLRNSGYHTGLVGKYLNSWRGNKRPEYDYWVSFPGGSSTYLNPLLNVQGEWQENQGYMTYLLEQHALSFLDSALSQEKPWMLLFTPNAPHDPFTPAEQDVGRWSTAALHRPPNFNEENRRQKPSWVRKAGLSPTWVEKIDIRRERQLEMLWSLDVTIGALLDKIEAAGQLNSTVIIYISDNGHFWGEHGLLPGKDAPYEEATHVPLAIRYPALTGTPGKSDLLVSNIDLAPTILDLAGVRIPDSADGLPIHRLLSGEVKPREALLLEGYRNDSGRKPFVAAVTKNYKYIENYRDVRELYDLNADPYEVNNIYRLRSARALRKEGRKALSRLLKSIGREDRLSRKTANSRLRRPAKENAQVNHLENLDS